MTSTATGSYATWCSATPGNEEVCSEAVHTVKANAYFGGVGGAHGTAGVTATVQGNPASTLTADATETGTFCDPFTEDPDDYSACQAYYDGSAVCSVMGALDDMPTAQFTPACPTSVTLSSTTPFSLASNFPALQTGIGIVAFMQLNPASQPDGSNWNGTQLTELVSANIDNCPSNIASCRALGALTVGTGGSGYGLQWPAQTNIMWDEHVLTSERSQRVRG